MHALKPTELAVVAWAGSRLARILNAPADEKLLHTFFQTLVGTCFVIIEELEGRTLSVVLWAARFGVNGRNLLRHCEDRIVEMLKKHAFNDFETIELIAAYNYQFPDGRVAAAVLENGFSAEECKVITDMSKDIAAAVDDIHQVLIYNYPNRRYSRKMHDGVSPASSQS